MTATRELIDFLNPILEQIEEVKWIGLSDGERMDRFSEASFTEQIYPAVFLIRPRYRGNDNHSGLVCLQFEAVLYVLTKADYSEPEMVDQAFDLTENIASRIAQVLKRKQLEGYQCFFDLNDYFAEPVSYVTMDSAVGYELKFRIGIPTNTILY